MTLEADHPATPVAGVRAHPERGGTPEAVSVAFVRAVVADPAAMRQLAGLNQAVRDEHGLAQLLARAAQTATAWLPDADWAGVTVTFDGVPFTAGQTDPVVLAVDQAQYDAGDGPCLQALRTGAVVTATPGAAAVAWPQFTEAATRVGMRSFLAAPLFDDDQMRASINLFSRNERGFAAYEGEPLQVLSALVRRGLAEYRAGTDARTQATQLQEAMGLRAVFEQARTLRMTLPRVTDRDAFALLPAQSQKSNTTLRGVATPLVGHLTGPDDAPRT